LLFYIHFRVSLPILAVLRFALRALCLQGRCSIASATPPVLLFGYIGDRVSLFTQSGLDLNPMLSFPSYLEWQVCTTTPISVEMGSYKLFAQASLEPWSSCSQLFVWDDRCVSPLCPVIGWDWVLKTICSGWPQTVILPISASQVARITGLSHWCPTFVYVYACDICVYIHMCVSAIIFGGVSNN
jgi:hypothetical protein